MKPYLRNFNVRWFDFDLSDVHEMRFAPQEAAKYTVVAGDVVVCEGGYPGRAAIWDQDEPIYFQKALHRVRFREPQRNKWFLYYLHAKDLEGALKDYFSGTGIQHFTGEALAEFEIPLPPLSEQQRIVGILDEAFAGVATAREIAERNLRNARALFESHLDAVFRHHSLEGVSWPLADLCDPSRAITYGVIKLGAEEAGGVPCLRSSNVRRLHVDTSGLRRIDPERSQLCSRTVIRGGEVLVNVRGTLGGVAVAAPEYIGWNISREVAIVPVDASLLIPQYCAYWIAGGASQRWLGGVKTGSTYIGINLADLRLLPVAAPSLHRQVEVVRHLDSAREASLRLESICQRKLAALDELKQSLLHQAFSGQL